MPPSSPDRRGIERKVIDRNVLCAHWPSLFVRREEDLNAEISGALNIDIETKSSHERRAKMPCLFCVTAAYKLKLGIVG